jgi:uncharacterized protein YgiM (DUF1202 family)
VLDRLDTIRPKTEVKTSYVTTRTVNVRSEPSKQSCVIGKIGPNNKVALIASKETWLYIEYLNYINAIPKMGWVYSEYLKPLPKDGK